MINTSKYLPKQMNGPVVSSVMQGLENELQNAETITDYLYNLSINTAQETELENIGLLIGFPRPLVPDGFNDEDLLILGTVPIDNDPEIGLATAGGSIGGTLSAIGSVSGNYMALGLYRKFLERFAYIKRYGITLKSVDAIASLVSKNYTITYDERQDINVTYNENIGFKNLWVLTQLFYRVATSPQVLITSNGGN